MIIKIAIYPDKFIYLPHNDTYYHDANKEALVKGDIYV